MYTIALLFIWTLSTSASDHSETFIFVAPSLAVGPHIASVGEHETFYQVWCSGDDPIDTRNLHPYVEDYFDIPYYTVCTVEVLYKHLHIFLQDIYLNEAMSAPILPVSSLGTKYVIPPHDASIISSVHVILATGNWTASVDVRFRHGNITRYDLVQYQTRRIKAEAPGITVSSSGELAVFTESKYAGVHGRYTYSQLTPSEDFGNEYVLAAGSLVTKEFKLVDSLSEEYYVNIICMFDDTAIAFNDGVVVIVGEEKLYHRDIIVNGSLHLLSSKPVMAYLCLKAELLHEDEIFLENPCTILDPVQRFAISAVVNIPKEAGLLIITEQDNDDFHAFNATNNANTSLISYWKDIPNTDYKVGTANAGTGTLFMKSTHKFTVIVNGYDCCSSPEYEVLLSISTSSQGIRQITASQSFGQGSSMLPTVTENKITLVVIGGACGFIIVILGAIIGFHVIFRKRNSEGMATESQNNPGEQETSFERDSDTPATKYRGCHINMVEERHNYPALRSEARADYEYESCDSRNDNRKAPYEESISTKTTHGQTYLELTDVWPAINEYEYI